MLFVLDWFFLILNVFYVIYIPLRGRKITVWYFGNILAVALLSLAIWNYQ